MASDDTGAFSGSRLLCSSFSKFAMDDFVAAGDRPVFSGSLPPSASET